MKDFIFIIGTSGIGKSTLAQGLFEQLRSTCIEQHMVPEFISRDGTEEMTGLLEEETCWENQKAMLFCFHKLGYRNIIASDIDDLRTRDIPIDFKGYRYITIRLVCHDLYQMQQQMKNRPNNGLIDFELQEKLNTKMLTRPNLPNEHTIDVTGKNQDQVLSEALEMILNTESLFEYDYTKPDKQHFYSWVPANGLR